MNPCTWTKENLEQMDELATFWSLKFYETVSISKFI